MTSPRDDRRIFLFGGPGGVGKTTLAASWALSLARQGHRTAVLTVDPAKRLAQALGLTHFDSQLQQVPEIPPLPGHTAGTLHASMLDSQRYFDRLIQRIAPTPEQRDRILNNRLYRIMVEQLGGSHEYAAMEQLLEYAQDTRFDKIVIDTPPAENAVELFRAPQRLAAFMDNSVLRWFQGEQKGYLRLFRGGTKLAMKVLQQVFGSAFLEELGQFLSELEGMQAGFQTRQREVMDILARPETAFFLVSDPSEIRLRQVETLLPELDERRIRIGRLHLNFVEPEVPASAPELKPILEHYAGIRREQQHWIAQFASLRPGLEVRQIARRSSAPQDIHALAQLGDLLIQ